MPRLRVSPAALALLPLEGEAHLSGRGSRVKNDRRGNMVGPVLCKRCCKIPVYRLHRCYDCFLLWLRAVGAGRVHP